MQQRSSGH